MFTFSLKLKLTITYRQMFTIILIELCLDLRVRWLFSMRRCFSSDIATILLSQATFKGLISFAKSWYNSTLSMGFNLIEHSKWNVGEGGTLLFFKNLKIHSQQTYQQNFSLSLKPFWNMSDCPKCCFIQFSFLQFFRKLASIFSFISQCSIQHRISRFLTQNQCF